MITPIPAWVRICGIGAVAAALPTVIWRVLVGLGVALGTPATWRAREQLPGAGTAYVVGLSVLQLIAALLTSVMIVPGADRLLRARRRLPTPLIVLPALTGALVLIAICVLGVINWHRVDPFGDAEVITGWSWLCWTCYLLAPLWPVLLIITTLGYARARRT